MRQRDRITAIVIALAIAVAVVALGSAPRWAACLASALALAAAAPLVTSRRVISRASPLLVLLGVAAGLTAIQLIPLPAFFVDAIAPARLALAADNAAALGHSAPSWVALSYDPPATLVELAKLASYGLFAFACLRVAGTNDGRRRLITIVAIAGPAVAACAVVHNLLGIDALYGIYEPRSEPPVYLAPLISENHLAGFLAMTVPLCLTLAVITAGPRRAAWIIAATASAGVTLLTESRGGAVALVIGVILTIALLVAQRRHNSERRKSRRLKLSSVIAPGIVAACVVITLVSLLAGGVREQFAETSVDELSRSTSKFGVWRASGPLIADNLWLGVGRGGFEPAFTRVHQTGTKTYSHVENEYLQALLDWGLFGAAALSIIAVWVLLLMLRRWNRSVLEVGATSAVIAICVHNVVDFSFQLPGVVLPVIAVAAVLMPASTRKAAPDARRRLMLMRGAALACGAVLVALASAPMGRTMHADGEALSALVQSGDPSAVDRGRALFAKHPSDYLIAGLLAKAYVQTRDTRALKLMNRALSLNPKHAGLHVLAAEMLLRGGHRDQALIELSLALRYTPDPRAELTDLLRWFPDAQDAARGVPIPPEHISTGRAVVIANRLVTMQRSDVALLYMRRVMEENPNDVRVLSMVARTALTRGEIALAIEAGTAVVDRRGSPGDTLVLGRALKQAEQPERALEVVDRGLESHRLLADTSTLMRLYWLRGELLASLGELSLAEATLLRAIGLSGSERRLQVQLYHRLAEVQDARGDKAAARKTRKLAEQLSQ